MTRPRLYLRERIGRHVGLILPVNGTRVLSRQPRPHTKAQRVTALVLAIVAGVLLGVCCGVALL